VFRTSKRIDDLETRVAALALAVAEIKNTFARSTPAAVLESLEALQLDLNATRSSLRSLHGKVAIEKRHGRENGSESVEHGDAEFQRLLDLQRGYTGSKN
jgi:uncharacterized coiled-coil protein SlyX